MGFSAGTRWGGDEREPTVERLREILGQLDAEDDEHPTVSLTHESEWYLAAYPDGLLIWENAEAAENPRHMNDVPRERVLQLWIKLSRAACSTRSNGSRGCRATRTRNNAIPAVEQQAVNAYVSQLVD